MRIHILGICGTFMGGLALIARELGHQVTGSDAGVYPPMSTQLNEQDIALFEGYSEKNLEQKPDLVVIGNALSRGNEELEAVLNKGIPYTSGAQWLAEHVLYQDRWTMAVAGTHGKTTTASLLAWILTHAGLDPGFLIGGVADNLGLSAKLGKGRFFVIEADEYDTAFFDKRSKFIHYRPKTAILNNLEFDHADIFRDLDAMKLQFHHFLRTVPANGRLFINGDDKNIEQLLAMGCWSEQQTFGLASNHAWFAKTLNQDNTTFEIWRQGKCTGQVAWSMPGQHNMMNALAAIAAADHAGVTIDKSIEALAGFKGVKRRLEVSGVVNGITVYDDFAHHPTEIMASLQAIRNQVGKARVIAVMEPRSNTMRMGIHQDTLAPAFGAADLVHIVTTQGLQWDIKSITDKLGQSCTLSEDVDSAVAAIAGSALAGDHIVIMSNGGFGGIHQRLLDRLK
ncbi:MAG: UDP-N-acetylmuramate:L-alanyl-gamma-D-glutamyl-meso-diaminopimelate ligase [Acidiferrobacterales bacterium]